MLTITIPKTEAYDEVNETFFYLKEQVLQLEHSLISLTKWEMEYKKPFISRNTLNPKEAIAYVKCMTLTQNVDSEVYERIPEKEMQKIRDYMDDPMTATTLSDRGLNTSQKEVITSEVIYYWMTALNIPFSCEKWHLNRLFTLIRVCNAKNAPSKKMSQSDIARRNRDLNNARKQALNSKG